MLLEICCDTIESAKNAELASADRIEFCSDLYSGGLTPSFALVMKLKEILTIPINILIRPRQGNFVYSDYEFQVILKDIEMFKNLNVNGFVCGTLNDKAEVNLEQTKQIIEQCYPLPLTFHRAVDNTKNYLEEMKRLFNIGVTKVLTSGAYNSVDLGFDNILVAHNSFGHKMTIMPGGGVNLNNISKFKEIGIKEIHSSASKLAVDNNYYNPELNGMGIIIDKNTAYYKTADVQNIKSMIELIRNK
jgi:copper homeostasis protein